MKKLIPIFPPLKMTVIILSILSLILLSQSAAMAAQPQIAAGYLHTVGLRSDGSVVAAGSNNWNQLEVVSWADIVQVAAGGYHTVGLQSGGTVVAVGMDYDGQTDVGGWTDIVQVTAGGYHTVGLKWDGTVVAVGRNDYGQTNVGGWTDIVQVAAGFYHTVGLKADGTVVAVGNNGDGQRNVHGWADIVQVAAGIYHTVGLQWDGTVVAVGGNDYGQTDVGDWTGIVQVSAGAYHTAGLRPDGTAVAVGYNRDGQLDVDGWAYIVQVAGGGRHTVGLRYDGKTVAVGNNWAGQLSVDSWTGIEQVTAGNYHTAALKSGGRVIAVGMNESGSGQLEVGDWSGIIQVDAGGFHTVGLESDGTAVAVGWYGIDVSAWAGIVQVAAGSAHTVGLESDGTVVAVGSNGYKQLEVGGWTEIVQVDAGGWHTVGLESDGTVVAVGQNTYRQLNVSSWTDIVQVAGGGQHTVGLKSDGTVVAVGRNHYGQLSVGNWSEIIQVAAGGADTVGLKSDRTVVAVGSNLYGELDVESWTDIVQVAAGGTVTVGLKSDGTVLITGDNHYGQCGGFDWGLGESSVLFLMVESPEANLLTSESSVTVSGTVNGDSAVASVTVNGNMAALASTDNPDFPNEMVFIATVTLGDGPNPIKTLARDISGKRASDTRNVYRDIGPPTIDWTPEDGIVTGEDAIEVAGTATDDNPITRITVNGNAVAFSSTGNPDDPNEVSFSTVVALSDGENQIRVVVEDNCTQKTTEIRYVTKQETSNRPPVADAGGDRNVGCVTGSAAVTLSGSGSSDPDNDPLTYSWSGAFGVAHGMSPTVTLEAGVHAVTLTVDDGKGGTDTDAVVITVNADTAPPSIALNGASTVSVACHGTFIDPGATAADDCSGVEVVTQGAVDTNTPGTYEITYTATDDAGLSASAVRIIIVSDTTPPILSGIPDDATVECDTVPPPAGVTAADSCDPAVTAVLTEARIDGANPYNYTLKRTWTAVDSSGNGTEETQTITVRDTQAPVLFGVPADVTVACEAPEAPVVTAADSCDPAPVVAFDETVGEPAPDCPFSFTVTRTWTATDESGNADAKTQVITVVDTEAPEVSISLEGDAPYAYFTTQGGVQVNYAVSDNCDAVPEVTFTVSNNGNEPETVTLEQGPGGYLLDITGFAGQNTLTMTAADSCGNTRETSVDFEVILELTGGELIVKPETLKLDPGEFLAFVVFPAPYSALTITDAVADGAGDQKINLKNEEQKAVIKFNRNDITEAYRPIDRFFDVSGHFVFNGAECEFVGTDDIENVYPDGVPGLEAGNTEVDKGEGEEKNR